MKEKIEFFEVFFPTGIPQKFPDLPRPRTLHPHPGIRGIFGSSGRRYKKLGLKSQNPPKKSRLSIPDTQKFSFAQNPPVFSLFFPLKIPFCPQNFLEISQFSLNFLFLYNFVIFSHNSPNFPRISQIIHQFFPKFS